MCRYRDLWTDFNIESQVGDFITQELFLLQLIVSYVLLSTFL
jgi:hypothetical protein